MDNARALEIMKEIKSFKIPRNGLEIIQANDLAIKVLEKQVSKKITRDSMYSPALCPTCHTDQICKSLDDGYYMYYTEITYCPQCGQELDWE